MAYRFEGDELVIDGWERGISDGPYSIFSPSALGPINQTGMVDLSYGNILGIPGEFSVQFPLRASTVNTSGGSALGRPIHHAAQIGTAEAGLVDLYYMLDTKGQIFTSDGTNAGGVMTWLYKGHVGSTSPSNDGNAGLVYWQGYLFTFRDTKIYYSSNDGATNNDWTGTVGSLTSTSTHYAISSQVSDSMYFCNGSSVGALILTPGTTFDPTNSSTYSYSQTQVRIPSYDAATCLAELNGQVLIGGSLNRVYPWDANNLSGTGVTSLVGLPLFLGDYYVQRIVVSNTNAYIFAGGYFIPQGRGNIYITNGSQIDIYKKMPDNIASISGTNSQIQFPYWEFGDAIFYKNQLIFGAQAIDNITGNTIIGGTAGVWAIDLTSDALYRMNLPTSGESALVTFLSSWVSGTNPGLAYFVGTDGVMNNTTVTLSTSARLISDKIPVGTKLVPKVFNQLELKCAVALVAGESIDVVVITDQDPSGHTVGSMTSTDGISKVFTPLSLSSTTSLQGIQWLQVKCNLNPTNTNPTFVRLREIRLR